MTVFIRILLRVIAGVLIGRGVNVDVANVLTDPDIAIGVEVLFGAAVWGLSEGWYLLAKRMGWRT